jgi:hypothetical protein
MHALHDQRLVDEAIDALVETVTRIRGLAGVAS